MILEESKQARRHRIMYRLAYRIFAAVMTIGIITMDLYIIFSTTVAHHTSTHNGEAIFLDIGPIMTRLCHNTTHHGGFGDEKGCMTILFYQLPIDDYAASSAMMMLALWIPIIAGLILTRLTFWKVHTSLQLIVSLGYFGVIYILIHNGYSLGVSIGIMAGRLIWVSLGLMTMMTFVVYKCCHEKYCLDVSDTPTLIGVTYDPEDDSEDVLSAGYWQQQKIYDD